MSDSKPVTLGDWYEILKLKDYSETAGHLNKQKPFPEWVSNYLLQWAPEVIVQRELTTANVSREYIMKKLAGVEAAATELADLLEDRAVLKFLQMPPHRPFQSELGVRMSISEIQVRAHAAATSRILLRGDGRENSGAGKAITSNDVNPKQLCAAIVAEAWCALHGAYPIASKFAAAAASAYWVATGGTLERSVGSSPVGMWRNYFDELRDDQLLWGKRKEMKRQLFSWIQQ